jgi:hypothetical protein
MATLVMAAIAGVAPTLILKNSNQGFVYGGAPGPSHLLLIPAIGVPVLIILGAWAGVAQGTLLMRKARVLVTQGESLTQGATAVDETAMHADMQTVWRGVAVMVMLHRMASGSTMLNSGMPGTPGMPGRGF